MISFSTFSTMHINLLETKKWGVKIQNEKQKLVAAKWGGVKMRRESGRMTKLAKTPDHNQNTLSGGFEWKNTRFDHNFNSIYSITDAWQYIWILENFFSRASIIFSIELTIMLVNIYMISEKKAD